MHIYFENEKYDASLIEPYLGKDITLCDEGNNLRSTNRVGYIFVSNGPYTGPVFILPKNFLVQEKYGRKNVLGMTGIYPQDVTDTDNPDNPLEVDGKGTFLPELGLWLYRSLNRFRSENIDNNIGQDADLDAQLPEDNARDKDFLSNALELIDFLKDHRNMFTQISLINHSGNNKIDWAKTVQCDPFFNNGEPWYLDPAEKDKVINIDDRLIVLYYSVLRYLRDKYRFPIDIGEVPYQLLPPTEVQKLIDTGIGNKELKRIRPKYYRDDLKHLWTLLDSFFAHNSSDEDKEKRKEYLLVGNFHIVFEAMIDRLVTDTHGVENLKKQDDGKLIDHIFRYTSLVGKRHDIYFIGDSKYYSDKKKPEGVALYKQFTYAKNAIQYNIDEYYLSHNTLPGNIRYRDTVTEGYNITPNFFIRPRAERDDIDFNKPTLELTYWDKDKHQKYPAPNKHFEDRLFDRDTLLLCEFSINLLFVIAAYAGYEDNYWASELHKSIRDSIIDSIDEEYDFYILTPQGELPQKFNYLYKEWLEGRAYMLDDGEDSMILAFEKTPKGKEDKEKFDNIHLRSYDTGEEVKYDIYPTALKELSK